MFCEIGCNQRRSQTYQEQETRSYENIFNLVWFSYRMIIIDPDIISSGSLFPPSSQEAYVFGFFQKLLTNRRWHEGNTLKKVKRLLNHLLFGVYASLSDKKVPKYNSINRQKIRIISKKKWLLLNNFKYIFNQKMYWYLCKIYVNSQIVQYIRELSIRQLWTINSFYVKK